MINSNVIIPGVGFSCPRIRESGECEWSEQGVRAAGQHGVGQRVRGQREHRDREPRQHAVLAPDPGQEPGVGDVRQQLRQHLQEVLHGPGAQQRCVNEVYYVFLTKIVVSDPRYMARYPPSGRSSEEKDSEDNFLSSVANYHPTFKRRLSQGLPR